MRIVILEDEIPAYNRLCRLINEVIPNAEIITQLDSIETAMSWFSQNTTPDLIFVDIHLADGSGLELIQELNPKCPYIFTTAYNEYALEAFKTNGIGYLLKPVKKEELLLAYHKVDALKKILTSTNNITNDEDTLGIRSRFMIRFGETIKTLLTDDIAYCYSENKATYAKNITGQNWPMDYNLDTLENMLPNSKFFRINRQYIVNINAIEEMKIYTKSRIIVKLKPDCKEQPVVSTERSAEFKNWLDGKV